MYKVAKKTLIDLNTTKIYLLKINRKRHCIEVKIVFSINKEDDYYPIFLKETLNFSRPNNNLFKLEDYCNYLADNCEYDLIEDNKSALFIHKGDSEYSTIYLCPNPYSNLLEQNLEDLIQLNHPKLKLLPSGLFTYHEFVDNSNTCRGILRDLKRLQQGKELNTRTTDECWLYKAITALDLHWN